MVSSASSQIEATAGDRLKTPAGLPDYGKVRVCVLSVLPCLRPIVQVSAILIGVVSGWIIVLSLVGKEAHSTHFEKGKVRRYGWYCVCLEANDCCLGRFRGRRWTGHECVPSFPLVYLS